MLLDMYNNLAEFEDKPAESESAAEMANENANVDVSAIIARLIEVERKLDNLTKAQQDKPTESGEQKNECGDDSAPEEKEMNDNAG